MTIKAIETTYNGYRFRSRLEARWAVFFDALGWKWQYELEGFELQTGYLPDFLVLMPRSPVWIEIKPNRGLMSKELLTKTLDKLSDLTFTTLEGDGGYGYSSALFFGTPGEESPPGYFLSRPMIRSTRKMSDAVLLTAHMTFGECPLCRQACLLLLPGIGKDKYPVRTAEVYCFCTNNKISLNPPYIEKSIRSKTMMACYDAARSARFEHGETPKVPRGKPKKGG